MKENKRYNFKVIPAFLLILTIQFSFLIAPRNREKAAFAETQYSKAECVMELESRRILYESNGETRLPMASTTKIVTAATVLTYCKDLNTPFEIPDEAIGIEGSSIYLKKGDIYSATDLLYGLMLRSGNDAATALALKTSGTIKEFSLLMNETAEKSGALNSNFVNPHGLPCKGHYTTARDLSYITCYAMHNTLFKKIVSTKFYEPCGWANKNKMLTQYEYAVGVKTGYTKEAGRCLVSAATKEDMTLVCSVLSCGDMYNRSIKLFENCFNSYKKQRIIAADDVFEVKIGDKILKGKTGSNFDYPLCEGENEHVEVITEGVNDEKKEEIIGQIKIYLLKRLIFSGNLYKL